MQEISVCLSVCLCGFIFKTMSVSRSSRKLGTVQSCNFAGVRFKTQGRVGLRLTWFA